VNLMNTHTLYTPCCRRLVPRVTTLAVRAVGLRGEGDFLRPLPVLVLFFVMFAETKTRRSDKEFVCVMLFAHGRTLKLHCEMRNCCVVQTEV